jgi:hypothetical protein
MQVITAFGTAHRTPTSPACARSDEPPLNSEGSQKLRAGRRERCYEQSAFVCIEELRELSLAWFPGRETLGEKCEVSLAELKLQLQLIAFSGSSIGLSPRQREVMLQLADASFEPLDPPSGL